MQCRQVLKHMGRCGLAVVRGGTQEVGLAELTEGMRAGVGQQPVPELSAE